MSRDTMAKGSPAFGELRQIALYLLLLTVVPHVSLAQGHLEYSRAKSTVNCKARGEHPVEALSLLVLCRHTKDRVKDVVTHGENVLPYVAEALQGRFADLHIQIGLDDMTPLSKVPSSSQKVSSFLQAS